MRRLWTSVIGVVAVAAILVGINLVAEYRLASAKLDLTQQRLYTLAPGTRKILADLKDPITLRFYYSRTLGSRIPMYGAYADRIALLREGRVVVCDTPERVLTADIVSDVYRTPVEIIAHPVSGDGIVLPLRAKA